MHYVCISLAPSHCGPFQAFEQTSELIHSIFFEKGEEHKASEFIKYLSSPGVMFAFLCALWYVTFYKYVLASFKGMYMDS